MADNSRTNLQLFRPQNILERLHAELFPSTANGLSIGGETLSEVEIAEKEERNSDGSWKMERYLKVRWKR